MGDVCETARVSELFSCDTCVLASGWVPRFFFFGKGSAYRNEPLTVHCISMYISFLYFEKPGPLSQRTARSRTPPACCLKCIESTINWLTEYAFVYVAVYGLRSRPSNSRSARPWSGVIELFSFLERVEELGIGWC